MALYLREGLDDSAVVFCSEQTTGNGKERHRSILIGAVENLLRGANSLLQRLGNVVSGVEAREIPVDQYQQAVGGLLVIVAAATMRLLLGVRLHPSSLESTLAEQRKRM